MNIKEYQFEEAFNNKNQMSFRNSDFLLYITDFEWNPFFAKEQFFSDIKNIQQKEEINIIHNRRKPGGGGMQFFASAYEVFKPVQVFLSQQISIENLASLAFGEVIIFSIKKGIRILKALKKNTDNQSLIWSIQINQKEYSFLITEEVENLDKDNFIESIYNVINKYQSDPSTTYFLLFYDSKNTKWNILNKL